jgi:SAM-dependent methyltransferase
LNKIEREARAISAVTRKKKRVALSGRTVKNRYVMSIDTLAELAKERKGKKLVVHLVGVGGEKGPQLREVISALTGKAGKRVSVHVMDFSRQLLREAVNAARKEFPDVEMTPYFLDGTRKRFDIAKAMALPREKADVIVCTNVILHLDEPSTHLALYQLASSLKKGGHLLISKYDTYKFLRPRGQYPDFGLATKKSPVIERAIQESRYALPVEDKGFIFTKTSKEKPFNVIWNKIKRGES